MGLLKCLNSFQLLLVFSEITGQLFIFTCSKRGQLLPEKRQSLGLNQIQGSLSGMLYYYLRNTNSTQG